MDALSIVVGGFSALFGGGVVAGIHQNKIKQLEKQHERLEEIPERLQAVESKLDLLLQMNGGNLR